MTRRARRAALLRVVTALLAGALVLGVTGCYGPAGDLNPILSFTLPDGVDFQAVAAGSTLELEVVAEVQDSSANPITGYQWRADPSGAAGGTFLSTTTASTQWRAPTPPAPLPVALIVTVKTLLGGKTDGRLNVTVVPPG